MDRSSHFISEQFRQQGRATQDEKNRLDIAHRLVAFRSGYFQESPDGFQFQVGESMTLFPFDLPARAAPSSCRWGFDPRFLFEETPIKRPVMCDDVVAVSQGTVDQLQVEFLSAHHRAGDLVNPRDLPGNGESGIRESRVNLIDGLDDVTDRIVGELDQCQFHDPGIVPEPRGFHVHDACLF